MCHANFGSIKFEDAHENLVTRLPMEKAYEEEDCKDTKDGIFKLLDTKNETSKVPAEAPVAEDPGAEDPAEHPAAKVPVEVPAAGQGSCWSRFLLLLRLLPRTLVPVEVPAGSTKTSTKASGAVGKRL